MALNGRGVFLSVKSGIYFINLVAMNTNVFCLSKEIFASKKVLYTLPVFI